MLLFLLLKQTNTQSKHCYQQSTQTFIHLSFVNPYPITVSPLYRQVSSALQKMNIQEKMQGTSYDSMQYIASIALGGFLSAFTYFYISGFTAAEIVELADFFM